ncbi:MAG: 3-phosphoshikimate 1-carboxyvinyltransferase [Bacteroidaceae bacterium]
MAYRITPPKALQGRIVLPASKSISNRALVIHHLADGNHPLLNLADCDDTQVMVRALNAPHTDTIDIRAAGTAMRFLTAYYAVTPGGRSLTGTQRMRQRPIRVLVDALRRLGADIAYVGEEGFPPLRINGKELAGGELEMAGHVSSQYVSALLLIAPTLTHGLQLRLKGDIVSRPYIDLTLGLMRRFGAEAGWLDDHCLQVVPGRYRTVPFQVESDWSAASYWYEMLALAPAGEVELTGLFADSLQGDSHVSRLFAPLGVGTRFHDGGATLVKTTPTLSRMDNDFVDQPDLAQTFVVTCALLGIPFRFSGLQSLKIKETDRLAALTCEMRKLGYVMHEEGGSVLRWEGERCAPHARPAIDTYEDHRMAMAFAPACLVRGDLVVNHPQVVSKSYPRFWADLQQAGFTLQEMADEPSLE